MADRKRNWDKTPEAAEYRRNYNKEHYDNLRIACPKGTIEKVDAVAKELGISRAAFVTAAINEKIEKSAQATKAAETL